MGEVWNSTATFEKSCNISCNNGMKSYALHWILDKQRLMWSSNPGKILPGMDIKKDSSKVSNAKLIPTL